MTDVLAAYTANRAVFDRLKSRYHKPLVIGDNLSHFVYSLHTRSFTSQCIRRGVSPHPHVQAVSEIASDRFKPIFIESRAIFLVPDGPFQNPPLHSLRVSKSTATQYIDFGGSLLSRPDPLRKLQRFSLIRYLSLRHCGLLDVSKELMDLPKTVRRLDLSANYVSEIPRNVQWRHLQGINLSANAFVDWPHILATDAMPELQFLSIAENAIGNAPERIGCARSLTFLDCSNTLMEFPPGWIVQCEKLRVLRFAGATLCVNFPNKFLAGVTTLKFVDLSGIGIVGRPLELGDEVEMLVMIGGDPSMCERVDVQLVL